MAKRGITKPNGSHRKIMFKDGEIGYVITAGEQQSLIHFEDGREQYYGNYKFKPAPLLQRKRKRKRQAINWGGAA